MKQENIGTTGFFMHALTNVPELLFSVSIVYDSIGMLHHFLQVLHSPMNWFYHFQVGMIDHHQMLFVHIRDVLT